jgi:ribonuclease R
LHITELGGEYYRFDEARQELRGERTGVRYGAGARLRVQVSRVDLDGRKIDFRLVREGQEERLLAKAQRGKAASRRGAGSAVDELSVVKERDAAVKKATRKRQDSTAGASRSAAGARSARGSAKPPGRGGKGR